MGQSITFPYHKKLLSMPEGIKPAAVLENRLKDLPEVTDQESLVRKALDTPVDSVTLADLSVNRKRICVITSDHTRPVPSRITMPMILAEIRKGNPEAEISILIATGFHRPTTVEELIDKFGEDIARNENIVMHFSGRDEVMADLGTLPSGGRCLINKAAVYADLLVAEGFIEPHFFAGYSGGRKSVLPGVASAGTVLANHCAAFISHPGSRTGNLDGNLIHRDMLWAAEQAGLAFILNVVLDEEKRIVHAVSGHFDKAHRQGCTWLDRYVRVRKYTGDIVITSNGGYPLDQNIYQAVKGMTAAERCCRPGGVIIMVASCCDGHGGQAFFSALKESESPSALLDEIERIPADQTRPDQWEYQILARILSRFSVIMVTDMCDHEVIRDMKMYPAASLEDALILAGSLCRSAAGKPEIIAIPDGVGIVLE